MYGDNIRRAMNIVDKYSQSMTDQEYLELCNCLMYKHSHRKQTLLFLLSQTRYYESVTDGLRIQALCSLCCQLGISFDKDTSACSLGILPCELDSFYESYRLWLNSTYIIVHRQLCNELLRLSCYPPKNFFDTS